MLWLVGRHPLSTFPNSSSSSNGRSKRWRKGTLQKRLVRALARLDESGAAAEVDRDGNDGV